MLRQLAIRVARGDCIGQRSGWRLDFLAAADNAGTARGTGEFVLLEASATFYKVAV